MDDLAHIAYIGVLPDQEHCDVDTNHNVDLDVESENRSSLEWSAESHSRFAVFQTLAIDYRVGCTMTKALDRQTEYLGSRSV